MMMTLLRIMRVDVKCLFAGVWSVGSESFSVWRRRCSRCVGGIACGHIWQKACVSIPQTRYCAVSEVAGFEDSDLEDEPPTRVPT